MPSVLTNTEIGQRIRLAREEGEIAVSRLAEALGVGEDVIQRLESGTLDPIPGDFILIAARVLTKDFRYFISTDLDEVEEETRNVYRALSEPSAADLLAVRRFIGLCTTEHELEELLEVPPRPLPPEYPPPHLAGRRHIEQAIHAAQEERIRLDLGDAPIVNVFDVLRSQGTRFFRHTLENSALSGVTIMHPHAGISVLVNHFDDLFRQFFSAAHEYAHVLFDRKQVEREGCVVSYQFSSKELMEIRANRFASHFLLPLSALRHYPKPLTSPDLMQTIRRIALDYRVNTETVARQMLEAQWIPDSEYQAFRLNKPVKIPRTEKRDPDIPKELTATQVLRRETIAKVGISQRLLELLRRGLTEGRITFGRFAEALDMTVNEADEFVRVSGLAL